MALGEPLPLAGRRVVVTRAPEQAADLIRRLRQRGAEVLLLPAVAFEDPQDAGPLDRAIASLRDFDWLLFTSQNAVRFFFKRCRTLDAAWKRDGDGPAGLKPRVAAVGPATAEAAGQEGIRVDYVASQFWGAALVEELGPRLSGRRILLPRSDRAGAELPDALRAKGAEVVDVVTYHTGVPHSYDRSVAEAIRRGEADVVTLLSPSAFHHLADEVGLDALRRATGRVALAAIGPVTSAAIRAAGLTVAIEAHEATAASLVAAIADYFAKHLPSGVKSP